MTNLSEFQTKTHNERAGNVPVRGWIPKCDLEAFKSLTSRAEEARVKVTAEIEADKEARKKC